MWSATLRFSLFALMLLTGCDAAQQQAAVAVANGTQAAPGSVVDPAVTLHDALVGSWVRVGQYCGTTYSTGQAEQHVAFSDSQMTVNLHFNCDNALHPAQYYAVDYDAGQVHVTLTQSYASGCLVYSPVVNAGTDTYQVQLLSDGAMQMTTGSCGSGKLLSDVYHKE